MEAPDCLTKNKLHRWAKWIVLEADHTGSLGFDSHDDTLRRTCKKCGWEERVPHPWKDS